MKASLLLFLVACSGDTSTPVPDADPNAPLCTGVVYDNCNRSDQCDSADCHFFEQNGFQVCTQPCSDANPCPADSTGTPGSCNNKGICKPTRNNACRPE